MQEIYNKDKEFDSSFNFPPTNKMDINYATDGQLLEASYRQLEECKQKLENSELELNLVSSFLCAILNELEATNNLIPTVLAAERNGKCDAILTWWKAHKNQDIQRLKTELNKHFSPQEIELLKKSLVGGNI